MDYDFKKIEEHWQKKWVDDSTYRVSMDPEKAKYYVLDMFPYPSGAGLHVGHPLGYIASDIFARYKTHKGFNVLHPQGYDSFGLPAEQYAIQTGQHPAITTKVNIEGGVEKNGNPVVGYRKQLDRIGFSYDWSREVRTSDPKYYRWTQWIFKEIYNSWYNQDTDKAEPISTLIAKFQENGTYNVNAAIDPDWWKSLPIEEHGFHFGEHFAGDFTATDWTSMTDDQQQLILLHYRLTYLSDATVNWCPALGTVLANDEVKDGLSERGGHPVVQKKMKQWMMRISAYAERLLQGLDTLDWTDSIKDIQRNWIGKSEGASVRFRVLPQGEGDDGRPGRAPGWLTADAGHASVLMDRAKEMRKDPTPAEETLWQALRGKKLGVKFRRQHPIAHYIVDFVCLEKQLIIEVDGEIHDNQKEEDLERTLVLEEKKGYFVIRFSNDEVLNDLDGVLQRILDILSSERIEENSSQGVAGTNSPSLGGGRGEDSTPTVSTNNPLSLGEGRGEDSTITVFTTRPDTIFGVSFMVLAPEHALVSQITTAEQQLAVDTYIAETSKKTERDRQSDVKNISGVFTGAYAINPFNEQPVPIWIADYVLAGYGTGAVMAVPAGDERDHAFAKHFDLPIPAIFKDIDTGIEACTDKAAILENSDFLDGMGVIQGISAAIGAIERMGIGEGKINYRLRDAVFSRQRYWGEPMPIYYKDGIPHLIDKLPVTLPEVDEYLPTEEGEPPLARADKETWNVTFDGDQMDFNTMPGWAGSSWYYLRYMDPDNPDEFCARDKSDYWGQVDLYMGGAEHATGHLLYSRFWCKFLCDRGFIGFDEPFKKMINQGMIQGVSSLVFRARTERSRGVQGSASGSEDERRGALQRALGDSTDDNGKVRFVSKGIADKYEVTSIHADVALVDNNVLDVEGFKKWRPEFADAEFILEDGKYICGSEVEKMSKSKYNVINPDELCEKYGADTLRCYEMFLGPIEQHKPWDTNGITGVHNFLRKVTRLYAETSDAEPTKDNLKTLHKTIKKVTEDIERYSFNTVVSALMICVNELGEQKCSSKEVLRPLSILLSPYAPHLAEELWHELGGEGSVTKATWPVHEEKYLKDDTISYPVSFNGKMRFKMDFPADTSPKDIEAAVLAFDQSAKYLDGKTPKKVIVVPKKIVNVVV